jgi:N-acetylglucosamine malate deacetylase 1
MTTGKNVVLVIAAHPDDEVLGCGGAIARHREEGDTVHVLIMGEGIASRAGIPADKIKQEQKTLRSHMARAHKLLGTSGYMHLALPDQRFETIPILDITHIVEDAIRKYNPEIIYTHNGGDINLDHTTLARAVESAVRPGTYPSIKEVRAFEVPSTTEWNFVRERFAPNVFISLTERQLKKKIDAARKYIFEMRDFPHPRSREYLESLARVRGGQSGFCAAEGFELVYRRII